jgi:hypothetical protein
MAGFTENYVKVYRPYNRDKVNTFETIVIGWWEPELAIR